MIGKILIAVLLGLFVAGVSMEANATEYNELQVTRDTVCATLATNGGYPYKAEYYIVQIKPYFAEHIDYIKRVVAMTHRDIAESVLQNDSTVFIESRTAFDTYCNRPFI